MTIGREGEIRLSDRAVSRRHCRIDMIDGVPSVTDLGSTGGTTLNGQVVDQARIGPGDEIGIGRSKLMVLAFFRYSDAAASDAVVVTIDGRDTVRTITGPLTIGRDPKSDITTDDPTVSRDHAVLRPAPGGGVELVDLGSSNHTYVNGAPVDGRVRLGDGDVMSFGRADLDAVFRSGPGSETLDVRVGLEGQDTTVHMSVAAPRDATVAQVTAQIAAQIPDGPEQAVLYRRRDGVMLHPDDLWHATGTWIGDLLIIGEGDASELVAETGRRMPARSDTRLNQRPRVVHAPTVHRVDAIDVPESTSMKGRGMVWQIAGGLGAVLIGLTLAVVNPSYAIFGLITGGIGVVSIMASIFGEQSRRRHKVRKFREVVASIGSELDATRDNQRAQLHDLYPDFDELATRITQGSPRIWERRPSDADALELRVGTGTRPALVSVDEPHGDTPDLLSDVERMVEQQRWLADVPVTVPAKQVRSLGISGNRRYTVGLLNRMIVEAATQLPPDQLRIVVAGTDPSWEWCRWLPHVPPDGLSTSSSEANEVLLGAVESFRSIGSGSATPGGSQVGSSHSTEVMTLVVVPDPSIRFDLGRLLGSNRTGLITVVGAEDQKRLPGGLDAILTLEQHDGRPYGSLTGRYDSAPKGTLWVDMVDAHDAAAVAIDMARTSGERRVDGPGGLVELLGLGSAADVDVIAAWNMDRTDPLTVPVGSDDSGGSVSVGFRRDGPHGLIAGTTGSGKSELLQSIIAAEVLQSPPDRLNLFMIDFKGGSTFAPFESLPHVVGMVTDIESDESLAERAFRSLDAEIERRKRLLDAARVPDIMAYERSAAAIDEPLANLIVVIDEFALLVQRLPDVRSRLDTVATQGRSLGIHLLLATQSPSGAITHAIRTNTNLWICLRVVSDSESVEVLGTRDAARIPDGSPGSGFIRLGAGESVRAFHAARIARPVVDETSTVRATRRDGVSAPSSDHGGLTELDLVVDAVGRAALDAGLQPARTLWLDPLPDVVTDSNIDEWSSVDVAGVDTTHLCTVVGLTEDLARRVREPYVVDMTVSGHLLATGTLGSGRTTTLQRVAADLSRRFSPQDAHLYGIDGGAGALQRILPLANVGDVIRSDDTERVGRLVDRLARELVRRREHLAGAGGRSFVEMRRTTDDLPWIVVLIDDYASVRENVESIDHGRVLERLIGLLQSGPAVGIHMVFTVTQATDVKTRELNLFGERIVLHSLDGSDYSIVGTAVPSPATPGSATVGPASPMIPGRGMIAGGRSMQVALPGIDGDEVPVESTVAAGARPMTWAAPVRTLPRKIIRSEISDWIERDEEAFPVGRLTLGVGGSEVEAVRVELSGYSPVLLVAGPPRSGRTTALINAVVQMRDRLDQVMVLAPRSRDWEPMSQALGLDVHDDVSNFADHLQSVLDGDGSQRLLVIDDADALVGLTGVADRLERILRTATQTETLVIISVRTGDLPGMFDPWSRYLVSLRRVLLLRPSRDDALYFGQTLPEIPGPVGAGRGILIEESDCTVVQCFDSGSS